ncbi:hypothetical protein GCM10027262_05220 [Nocardia tengchongensis]
MQAREDQFHFRLHTDDTKHLAIGRPARELVEQCRLAHPGITAEHQYAAFPGAYGFEQVTACLELGGATDQARRAT